ncbi:armadillo repeat-containing protein 2 isoform X2 [Contarinia nasturtii]|uniref:armadillo repeat-containing protein 2 isoform X2 n=1 Tax=Contarinia nasturtii TaxID=265458 RepID=UPI0012D465D3|nr:armadillo repeat-containing protein 2 isoform X2 [Contarinia nasturtii]
MLPNTKQKLKSDQNDVVSALSALSMPSLASKPQQPITRSLEMHRSNSLVRYKTTAETISETKRMLSNGVRLVSTRRPITPREPRRQLYGKISLADRPPSAFSLSYLQLENRVLPPIGTTSLVTKLSLLNGVEEPDGSIKNVDDEMTSNRSALQQQQHQTDSCAMGNNVMDLRAKSDKNNRNNGCPKLPTLLSDMKSGTSSNSFSGESFSANDVQNISAKTRLFNGNMQKNRTTIANIFEDDGEQITLPLTDDVNQSCMKKQPISVQRRLLTLRGNDLLASNSTETLLEMLKAHSGIKDCSEETILHINGILTELYTRVKGVRNDWRSSILSALYGLVECTSAKILLSVARVVLVLDVVGSNLTGACKLVFKVARNERNDNLFANIDVPELLIDGLGRASPIDDAEACIYGYGAVRFLANAVVSSSVSNGSRCSNSSNTSRPTTATSTTHKKQKTLASRLYHHGANDLMILHLMMINETGAAAKLPTQTLHALYQLSSALRALSKIIMSDHGLQLILSENNNKKCATSVSSSSSPSPSSMPKASSGSIDSVDFAMNDSMKTSNEFDRQITLAGPHLIRAAEICINQAELQLCIIRTLSILSEHESCCDGIADMAPRLAILLGPIILVLPEQRKYNAMAMTKNDISNKSLSLLNRIGYILGNIMAQSDSARLQFYNNDVAMEYLLKCLEYYANETQILRHRQMRQSNSVNNINELSNDGDDANDCQIDTVTDVVIKLIRVIANLSVNAEVGYKLANHHQLGAILLALLNTINKHRLNFNSEFEELLLATLGAVHNLSFYQNTIDEQQTTNDDSKETNHPQSMIKQMTAISAALCAIYQWSPESAQSEIARVLGNLTRSLEAREAVFSAGGLEFLLKNLSSDDWDIVETSCGVLVNMLSDWERRSTFRELHGPFLLRDVLQRSALKHDWLLALIACQAIWNYIIDSGNAVGALGESEADYISADILELLGK